MLSGNSTLCKISVDFEEIDMTDFDDILSKPMKNLPTHVLLDKWIKTPRVRKRYRSLTIKAMALKIVMFYS